MLLDSLLLVLAQTKPVADAAAPAAKGIDPWSLFVQTADPFTYVLLTGSVIAGAVIVRSVIEIRKSQILPPDSERTIRRLLTEGRTSELKTYVERDESFLSHVVRAAVNNPAGDRAGVRSAAELAASEQCAVWFRKIEPLNVVGNLGPLLGLAGTVYGMIKAFVSLGQSAGQANPAGLSEGIAKALFHTLLGLLLAIPALTVFGFYRSVVDKLCTRAMAVAAELVDMIPVGSERRDEVFTPARPKAEAEAVSGARA